MPKLTLQVRTRDNLSELLAARESPAWKVHRSREALFTQVHVVSFDGTQRIEGEYDREGSYRRNDGRLVVRFRNPHLVNCRVTFDSRNPVRYLEG